MKALELWVFAKIEEDGSRYMLQAYTSLEALEATWGTDYDKSRYEVVRMVPA